MNILGIESSCDETAASVWSDGRILSNVIASQSVHEQFGGVVPELASRAHHKTITKTVRQALIEAGMNIDEIGAVAVSQGPGLMGSLLVGLSFAKGLALSRQIPVIGVNHIDAHIYASFIEHKEVYPFVALVVSGGHTRLVYADQPFKHEVLGRTRDDAAGEAFDKIGKILGLPYPGGPEIDRLARGGDPAFHDFPRSMIRDGFDFSFSGLKTSVLYYVREKGEKFTRKNLSHICASVSEAIVNVLTVKVMRAAELKGTQNVLLAGGVSANSVLRSRMKQLADEHHLNLMIPSIEYCTDNAAMIAVTGALKARENLFDDLTMKPFARIGEP